jgi:hypothetical protein
LSPRILAERERDGDRGGEGRGRWSEGSHEGRESKRGGEVVKQERVE